MVERILDCQGNPIGITTLYHDPSCGVYFDNCFIRSFSQEKTTFQYEDGRMREFTDYSELVKFTQNLKPLPSSDQQRFPETQLRAKILEEESKHQPTKSAKKKGKWRDKAADKYPTDGHAVRELTEREHQGGVILPPDGHRYEGDQSSQIKNITTRTPSSMSARFINNPSQLSGVEPLASLQYHRDPPKRD